MKDQNYLVECYHCALSVDKDWKTLSDDYSHSPDSDIQSSYHSPRKQKPICSPCTGFQNVQVQWNCSFFILQSVRVALKHCVTPATDSK